MRILRNSHIAAPCSCGFSASEMGLESDSMCIFRGGVFSEDEISAGRVARSHQGATLRCHACHATNKTNKTNNTNRTNKTNWTNWTNGTNQSSRTYMAFFGHSPLGIIN